MPRFAESAANVSAVVEGGRRDRKTRRNIERSLKYCSTVGALRYSPCLFEALCETLGHARFKYDLGVGLLPLVGKKGPDVLRHTAARATEKKTETEEDKTRRSERKIRAAERESESA